MSEVRPSVQPQADHLRRLREAMDGNALGQEPRQGRGRDGEETARILWDGPEAVS